MARMQAPHDTADSLQTRAREPRAANIAPLLYQAALADRAVRHYLPAFERQDAVGRVLAGWNWAAALLPLPWLVFRRLWREAALGLLALLVLAALAWAAPRLWPQLPLPMLAGVVLAMLLLLCAACGLYGDALVHAQVRRRIDAAVTAASTVSDALQLLRGQASGRRWGAVVGVCSIAVLAGAAAIGWRVYGQSPVAAPDAGGVSAPSLEPLPQQPAAVPEVALTESTSSQPLPAEPLVPADTEAAVASQAGAEPGAQQVPAVALPVRAADQEPAPARAVTKKAADRAPATTITTAAPASRRLYVNVGLFADPDNVRRARERLQQAGLPVQVQAVARSDGRRLQRLRVGPFGSAAQASDAVRTLQAMGLDAQPVVEAAAGG